MKYNLISLILIIVFFDTDLNLFLFNDSLSKVKYYSFFESDSNKEKPVLKPIKYQTTIIRMFKINLQKSLKLTMYTKILKKIMWVNFMWLYRFW